MAKRSKSRTGQNLPKMKGRKALDLRVEMSKIDEVVENLGYIGHVFWACDGPNRPVPMITCTTCLSIRTLLGIKATMQRALDADL